MKLSEKIAALIDVKSIVTLVMTGGASCDAVQRVQPAKRASCALLHQLRCGNNLLFHAQKGDVTGENS